MRRIIRRQSPIKGGRDPLPSCVLHEIQRAVERKAAEFGVSKSWVIATILADFFGIEEQTDFRTGRKPGERKKESAA